MSDSISPIAKFDALTYQYSRKNGVLIDDTKSNLVVVFQKHINLSILAELQRHLGLEFEIKVTNNDDFNRKLQLQAEKNASGSIQVTSGMNDDLDIAKLASELDEPDDLLESNNDAPIVKLLNALITEAVREEASDIHIEQYESRLRIRFRIDGALKGVLEPNYKVAPLIVSRIKVMAKLDIAEKRLPQDGRISVKIGGKPIDVRVSTIPTSGNSERVVLRLLNKDEGRLNLDYLGMPAVIKEGVESLIKRPHGVLLVTGPTGSGKTTTLYAMLSHLNDQERNIMTVEDPIEYHLDGINQMQVNTSIGMDFSGGLRSILRQDPDVIMVGEVRDKSTAKTAVQASLTGHFVFSTLHTNTAVGAVTRLRDMGVEPFLLASSLSGVLAQRLVRRLCQFCKQKKLSNDVENSLMRQKRSVSLFEAKGCSECSESGYKGRIGLFEFFEVDKQLSSLIHNNAAESELLAYVRGYSQSLFNAGVQLVLDGGTSLDEIMRIAVASEEDLE